MYLNIGNMIARFGKVIQKMLLRAFGLPDPQALQADSRI